ncbi:MAG: helix-turn-helix domain-containing protein [Acidobacteria bacterium]|nr:helix-turn-helix domain-containing protein [Acidobacteriota bacterium]
MPAFSVRLTDAEREELTARARHGRGSADVARRSRVVLLLDAGRSYAQIREQTGVSSRTVALWKKRFEAERLEGLFDRRTRRG